MSLKGKKSNKNKTSGLQKTQKISKPAKITNYSKIIKRLFITLCLIGVIAVPVNAYIKHSQVEHDLSVIGNGTSTVVQIHDPGCRLCQRLKSNLDEVKGEFEDNIQFKTANILKQKGKRFATKHNVPHVTLLFFNKRGKRVNTMQGVSTADEIKTSLGSLIKSR